MTLFWWEVRKTCFQRAFWICALLLAVLFLIVGIDLLGASCGWQAEDGSSYVYEGFEAIRWEKEMCMPFDGRILDDEFVAEVNALLPDRLLALDEVHYLISPFLSESTTGTPLFGEDGTVSAETTQTIRLVKELLGDMEYCYRYSRGWRKLLTNMEALSGFAVLMGVFLSCLIYAGEYGAGTDSLLLSAKYGKYKLGCVKFAVGLLIPAVLVSLVIGILALFLFFLYGFGGGDGHVMLFMRGHDIAGRAINGFLPEDMGITNAGAAWNSYLTILLTTLLSSALAMALSSICRSTVSAVAVTAGVLLAPGFVLSLISEAMPQIRMVQVLLAYTPYFAIQNASCNWYLYQMESGDTVLRYLFVLAILAGVLVAGSALFAVRRYAKHRVQ